MIFAHVFSLLVLIFSGTKYGREVASGNYQTVQPNVHARFVEYTDSEQECITARCQIYFILMFLVNSKFVVCEFFLLPSFSPPLANRVPHQLVEFVLDIIVIENFYYFLATQFIICHLNFFLLLPCLMSIIQRPFG